MAAAADAVMVVMVVVITTVVTVVVVVVGTAVIQRVPFKIATLLHNEQLHIQKNKEKMEALSSCRHSPLFQVMHHLKAVKVKGKR
jgi:hypothetical protein